MKQLRIVVAENHSLVLRQIESLLKGHHNVVAVVESGIDLVRAAIREEPDLVVTDISLPVISGLEAARAILGRRPHQRIVFLTNHLDPAMVEAVFAVGGVAFVSKPHAAEDLDLAITAVLDGGRYVSPAVGAVRLPAVPGAIRVEAS